MNKLMKGLVVAGFAAMMVACGTVKSAEVLPAEKVKEVETVNTSLLNGYGTGTYCVAVDGMRERAAASTNSEVVYDTFQKGVYVEVKEVVLGQDGNSVWARLDEPVAGYMCICDATGNYLLTKEAYAQSGILTDAAAVTGDGQVQGIGSGVTFSGSAYVNRTYTVVVEQLNVRAGASTNCDEVGTMYYGDQVYVSGVKMNEEDGSVWALAMDGFVCIHDAYGNEFMRAE